MPPTYQRAAHWVKSRVIILCYLLLHDLKQRRRAGGDGIQFAGRVTLYQNAGATIQPGAVCDSLKPTFRDADRVNFRKALFGQVGCGVGGDITANLF